MKYQEMATEKLLTSAKHRITAPAWQRSWILSPRAGRGRVMMPPNTPLMSRGAFVFPTVVLMMTIMV
jgi:hypothetical protein